MLKCTRSLLPILLIGITAHAQKLPNKQETSVWLPANFKIDGRTDEWDGQLQAYNNATEVFYTVANDNDDLYLVIHAARARIIEKIIESGISLTIAYPNEKKDKNNTVVLFPLLTLPTAKGILITAEKSITGMTFDDKGHNLTDQYKPTKGIKRDIAITKANKELRGSLKMLKVSGMPDVTDTLRGITEKTPYYRGLPLKEHRFKFIQIINHDHIKAMVQFDDKGELTYELSIPLKYIGQLKNNNDKLSYNIAIHGRGEVHRIGNTWSYNPPRVFPRIKDIDLETKTDFSGEYTLAKKP